jgi:hypothetical protein
MVGLVAAIGVTACSGSEDAADEVSASSPGQTITTDRGPDFVPTPGDGEETGAAGTGAAPPTTEFDLASEPSTPPIEPIPETGVPGIDSSDAFCRAWSEFAGSFQALALVSAIGDPAAAYRLEVIAASTVTEGVAVMEANLPTELESERGALIAELAGPFFGRAVSAEAGLLDAGLEPSALRAVWLEALTEAGVDDPELDVVLPASIDSAALTAAVAAFADTQPAIVEDPALITDAMIPLTEAYLAESCPDGGILSGNDVIDN